MKRPLNPQPSLEFKPRDAKKGVGIKFSSHDEDYITILKGKRRVIFTISSWRGISIGAIHYYGYFRYWDLNVKNLKTGKITGLSCRNYPEEAKSERISVEKISEKTIRNLYDEDARPRVRKGFPTECFDTVDEVIIEAKKVAKLLFNDEWEIDWEDIEDWKEKK